MRALLLLVCWPGASIQGGGHSTWNYLAAWDGICASGRAQSPVDIRVAEQVALPSWQFQGYGVPRAGQVTNNGHTFQFDLEGRAPQVGGGGLGDDYTFAQGHFHWGNSSSRGSEHHLAGHAFPLELHLVHFNSKYSGLGEAVQHADGLAVIGILFSVSPRDNPSLAPLLSSSTSVLQADGSKHVPTSGTLSLASLLPDDTSAFYRYSGSLTTPTCNEVVTWSLLHHPAGVSEAQLAALRALQDSDHTPMGDNFRAVQPLHGRKVVASGLGGPLVIEHSQPSAPEGPAQWYWSMVPGWPVVLMCLAVSANTGVLVMLAMRRRGSHTLLPTDDPK